MSRKNMATAKKTKTSVINLENNYDRCRYVYLRLLKVKNLNFEQEKEFENVSSVLLINLWEQTILLIG